MDMTHFIFETNAIIQCVRVGDMRIEVSYAMSLHKVRPYEIVTTICNYVN